MFKSLWLMFWLFFFCLSCGFNQDQDDLIKITSDDIVLWNLKSLPVLIYIDDKFSKLELDIIAESAKQWEIAADINLVESFQNFTPTLFPNASDYYYQEPKMTVQKINHKVDLLSPNVLALTQLYIKFIKKVDGIKVFHITHFDILVNDFYFNFNEGGGNGNYDFKTIILHEFGHAVGISGHIDNTIMNQYGRTDEVTHNIDSFIQDKIYDIYHNENYQNVANLSIAGFNMNSISSSEAILSFMLLK